MWNKEGFTDRLKGLDIREAVDIVLAEKQRLQALERKPKPDKGKIAAHGHYSYKGDIDFLDNLHMILTTGFNKKLSEYDEQLIKSIIDNLK